MRDDELRYWLRERNPWWRSAGDRLAWTGSDIALRGADSYGIDYRPPIIADVRPGGLYVVRGPRRVGKSVALKRLAADLLGRQEMHPSQLIYMTLDEFDQRALRRALRLGRELTHAAGERHRYWLLDEITAVEGWPALLKSARDDTPLANDTVVVTGSSAHGLTEARRALGAGRVGPVTDPFRLLLPMTFRDFVRLAGRDIPPVPAMGPAFAQDAALRRALAELSPHVDEIDLAWQAYCEVGGFPRAVGEYLRDGNVSMAFATDLVDWLAPDVTPEDPPESVLRLIDALARRMASPLNVRATADAIGMTRERLTTRLNRLFATFGAMVCPQVDDNSNAITGSQSKVYLLDPLIAMLPYLIEPALGGADMSVLSEAVLAATLARSVDNIHPGRLLEGRALGYTRTPGKAEVDFAPIPIRIGGAELRTPPIESKWVSDGWRPGGRVLENQYGAGFIATKNILDLSTPIWAVPAGVVALLLA